MSASTRLRFAVVVPLAVVALSGGRAYAQADLVDPATNNLPNPYQTTRNWGTLPEGRTWGSTAGIDIGPDRQTWALDRCSVRQAIGNRIGASDSLSVHAVRTLRGDGDGSRARSRGRGI